MKGGTMSKDKREKITVTTYNWGPCLVKLKIADEFKKLLLSEGEASTQDYTTKLAGQLHKEVGFRDKGVLVPWLANYIGIYDKAHESFMNKKAKVKPEYVISALWINYQKQFDFNPPHDHDGALSFVIYLQIPDELKKENEAYVGKSGGPGGIQFLYGEGTRDAITYQAQFPEEGDMYIFPAWLKHYVSPFKSDCTRISVSGNIHDSVPFSNLQKKVDLDKGNVEFIKKKEEKK